MARPSARDSLAETNRIFPSASTQATRTTSFALTCGLLEKVVPRPALHCTYYPYCASIPSTHDLHSQPSAPPGPPRGGRASHNIRTVQLNLPRISAMLYCTILCSIGVLPVSGTGLRMFMFAISPGNKRLTPLNPPPLPTKAFLHGPRVSFEGCTSLRWHQADAFHATKISKSSIRVSTRRGKRSLLGSGCDNGYGHLAVGPATDNET